MSAILYPTDLPITDIQAVITIFGAGGSSVVTNRSSLAKHLWLIQGYGQSMLFGDPDAIVPSAAPAPTPTVLVATPAAGHDLVDLLKQVVKSHESLSPQALDAAIWVPLLQMVATQLFNLLADSLLAQHAKK